MTQITDISPLSSNTTQSDKSRSVIGRMLSLACLPDGSAVYTGSYSNVWNSDDGGQNWESVFPTNWPPQQPFDVPGTIGGWCAVDIAAALGWRVEKHPRFVVPLRTGGPADIVGFGDCGVWTALGDGLGGFQAPNVVIANFGYNAGGWRVDRHPRFLAVLTNSGFVDIIGFGDAGVWTALGNGDGTFQEPKYVLAEFGYQQGWRVDRHPRFLAVLTSSGFADIVGFGNGGVFTALSNGDGTFQLSANPVLADFGYNAGGWRVNRHPRILANLTHSGYADIVGFGDAGVWTAISKGDGTFQDANYVLDNFGTQQGWQVDRHPRFLANLTSSGVADIVGFGDAGVWTALGKGDGTFQDANYVLDNFGYEAGSWRVNKHPRFLADLTNSGYADIVGFGDAGVWTALGNGDGTFQNANFTLEYYFSVDGGWKVERHPRFVTSLAGSGPADIVGFSDSGVMTSLGDGAGGFPLDKLNSVLNNFGYLPTVLALIANDLVAGGRGIWRSTDGGLSWTKVHQFPAMQNVGQLEWALGSDHLAYAAGGSSLAISKNAGTTFEDVFPWGRGSAISANHVALWQNSPADPFPAVIYVLGDSAMSLSFDGGVTWMQDQGTLPPQVGGAMSLGANSNSPKLMVISPRFFLEVFVAGNGSGAFTPAALWRGDYTQFPLGNQQSSWDSVVLPEALEQNLSGSPVFQDNGNVFLATTQHGRGNLLFYGAQRSYAYVGPLDPTSASDWKMLDQGHDVHQDLHGILLSPDFDATIENGNYQPHAGTVWMVSDGGIYRSTDGGQHFAAAHNATTLSCVNVAVVSIEGQGTALYLNTGDNDGFYSLDGGQHWSYQQYGGGDNDCSFADPLRPYTMLVFTPRWDTAGNMPAHTRDGQTVAVYETSPGNLPNAASGTHDRVAVVGPPTVPASISPAPDIWNASSFYGSRGSRPIVLGLPTETPPAQGDYIFILFNIGAPSVLVRTQNIKDIKHRYEWETTATGPGQGANVYLQGPPLPIPDLGVVQAAGGHDATVFYVGGDAYNAGGGAESTLWTWTAGSPAWTQLVPAPVVPGVSVGATYAVRFFVSPYQPNLIYLLDIDHVKRSDDGGTTWVVDQNLEAQLTWNGEIVLSSNDNTSGLGDHFDLVLTDMKFDPYNQSVRFAVGLGGAVGTVDGVTWTQLLNTEAIPGRPANCVYDGIANPDDPALYVAFAGRSLVKITDLPQPPVIIF